MEPFTQHKGIVAPLEALNVDTDQIIPKQFLKRIERTGYGEFLFFDWRYNDDGSPNPDFEMNAPRYKGASILLTKDNFGCGSSREHAPWAIADYGFNTIISTSYADIFYNNCFKNGILPIVLPQDQVDKLMDDAARGANATVTVDLENQTISGPDGGTIAFDVYPFRKHCLLNGLDDIGLTLEKAAAIDAFEAKASGERPWV